jgi:hypothetical protein
MDLDRATGGCRRHGDVGQAEDLLDGPALGVDRLHAGDGRDPALLVEPPGLRVDRRLGDLPPMHPEAPLRHQQQVRCGEKDRGRCDHHAGPVGYVTAEQDQRLDGTDHEPAGQRPHGPVGAGLAADQVGWPA